MRASGSLHAVNRGSVAENLTSACALRRLAEMAEDQIQSEPVLSEPLTWQEICARYPIRALSPLYVGL